MIVTEEELKAKTGYSSRGHLETWLNNNRIPYWRGKNGVLLTTVGLLESSKLGHDRTAPAPAINF